MAERCERFIERCLLLDIEINERAVVYSLGAVLGAAEFSCSGKNGVDRSSLIRLAEFGADADYVLGHSILAHDIPRLRELAPDLPILDKPVIDTLYLSPLAFPENPYHKLVKNYKLVRDSISEPVQDALLAGKVFSEQWHAFAGMMEEGKELPILYRSFFAGDNQLKNTSMAFGVMGGTDSYRR